MDESSSGSKLDSFKSGVIIAHLSVLGIKAPSKEQFTMSVITRNKVH